jgi:predicted dehydrogenase
MKVRWGLIGCGDIAQKRVAPALRDSDVCELVAVSRAQSHLAESFAKQFGAHRWYSDWRDLLLDHDIDAVYVATPVHLHAEQTIAAAESRRHVLCEKPMSLNVADCERMIAACRANNVKLGVAYYRHFYPVITRIKQVIESGEIGKPVLAQINAYEWFDPRADHPRSWLLKQSVSGGGPMFDFGCHRIEVLIDLFGPPTEVRGVTANALFEREVEDTAAALFRFESGVCGTLAVSHAAQESRDTLDVFGSQGSIHVPVLNEGKMCVIAGKNERTETLPPGSNLHQPLIEDFVAAIAENREPIVNGVTGKLVAQIEEDIYRRS